MRKREAMAYSEDRSCHRIPDLASNPLESHFQQDHTKVEDRGALHLMVISPSHGILLSSHPHGQTVSIRTSDHSLKPVTETKCQVDGSGFLCDGQMQLCGGKICTWWPWKPSVPPLKAAYSADKLTPEQWM
ncbi:unnamed protein product [Pleuronectes platessa]|uniref:Uncharacterized protein n=1 Tax=Pleuronectes platessa TaxID=8262 RepID=A0A9N7YCP4_PLEPL|nr:unnamed protein product [Pleuronectes platessa]